MSCHVGCRCSSDLALLWQWHGPAAVAPIGPLAWEPPYATGVALKIEEEKKKKQKHTLRYRDEMSGLPEGKGVGGWGKMMMGGDCACGGDHSVVPADVGL